MQEIKRTADCGKVTTLALNRVISLAGWVYRRRDHGGLIFVDLRDRSGVMQLVFNPEIAPQAHQQAHVLRVEYVIAVTGTIMNRSENTINHDLPTGHIELLVSHISILNSSKTPPFALDTTDEIDEEVRLTYRYLDLRRPSMHQKFALRNKVLFSLREFLQHEQFYELETPILTKNTPEGAREFLVPARMHPGSFYVLPQSPQLYKQLLMAAGMEKYFQIARCFRDEDLRADRQPEFTQLDIEMSFIDELTIQSLIEQMLAYIFKKVLGKEIPVPFARMTYDTAFSLYGSDKPDLRYNMPIYDCTNLLRETTLHFLRAVLDKGGRIGGLHVAHSSFSHSELNRWVERAQKLGAAGLLWIQLRENGAIESPVHKFLPSNFVMLAQELFPDFKPGSTLFLMAGDYLKTWQLLGQLRIQLAHALQLVPTDTFNFSWITDFPLFEYDVTTQHWSATHHPFTAPQKGWESMAPEHIKARAYDVILNGVELGGGSIRIHTRAEQEKVFTMLGLSSEAIATKFGFLLRAQEYGFPPHGGIALGLDRLLMMMTNAESIREVILFPKTQRGCDLMMESPTPVDEKTLREYNLKYIR